MQEYEREGAKLRVALRRFSRPLAEVVHTDDETFLSNLVSGLEGSQTYGVAIEQFEVSASEPLQGTRSVTWRLEIDLPRREGRLNPARCTGWNKPDVAMVGP